MTGHYELECRDGDYGWRIVGRHALLSSKPHKWKTIRGVRDEQRWRHKSRTTRVVHVHADGTREVVE